MKIVNKKSFGDENCKQKNNNVKNNATKSLFFYDRKMRKKFKTAKIQSNVKVKHVEK